MEDLIAFQMIFLNLVVLLASDDQAALFVQKEMARPLPHSEAQTLLQLVLRPLVEDHYLVVATQSH